MTKAVLNPALARVALGKHLRVAMDRAGKDRDDIAAALGFSAGHVNRVLKGERGLRQEQLTTLFDLLDITGEDRRVLEGLQREASRRRPKSRAGTVIPGRFRRFQNREETARAIRIVCADLMNGLLQTERVIRSVLAVNPLHRPEVLDDLVEARRARQASWMCSSPSRC